MLNFGKINNAFNELFLESFINKDMSKKKTYNTFLKKVNENKVLKTQFHLYNNLSEKFETNEFKASEYIKESINLMNKFSIEEISNANEELLKLIPKNINLLDVEYVDKELHENISNLIKIGNNKSTTNIDLVVESINNILTHISSNKPEEIVETVNYEVINLAINKFNDKYSNLDEDESKLLKSILNEDTINNESTFRINILECVDLIDKSLLESDLTIKEKLLGVKDKILRMSYNEETYYKDISKIIELKNNLK